MNAPTPIRPPIVDDILIFVPNCAGDEYVTRAKLRTARNIAGAMIAQTQSPTCRTLAWIAQDYAADYVFALEPDPPTLAEIARFCDRVLICAAQIERFETVGRD